jgi:succinate dehydrogenase / fumarate reductase, membrane anchor subunit
MAPQSMRSSLGRAAGLGSAKGGVAQWWAERVSAVALIPLTLWLAASLINNTGSDYAGVIAWLQSPLVALLLVLLLISLFSHLALGLRVIIEDYIHSGAKFAALLIVRFTCFSLCIAGILATLRIALIT